LNLLLHKLKPTREHKSSSVARACVMYVLETREYLPLVPPYARRLLTQFYATT
jgi:hypothetical protein